MLKLLTLWLPPSSSSTPMVPNFAEALRLMEAVIWYTILPTKPVEAPACERGSKSLMKHEEMYSAVVSNSSSIPHSPAHLKTDEQ